jgi:hypothetical protein
VCVCVCSLHIFPFESMLADLNHKGFQILMINTVSSCHILAVMHDIPKVITVGIVSSYSATCK